MFYTFASVAFGRVVQLCRVDIAKIISLSASKVVKVSVWVSG